ncbi:MAG: hypothetical protein HC802_13580 [Caldilineaceae bacterium]|nr:hypothetical protein [Caldilineaceae bacterium]
MSKRVPYLWDYDIDETQFRAMLSGELALGRLDRDWAAVRLLEYAPYPEVVELLGFGPLVQGWPTWRQRIRSQTRLRAFDFLVRWLSQNHPGLLQ